MAFIVRAICCNSPCSGSRFVKGIFDIFDLLFKKILTECSENNWSAAGGMGVYSIMVKVSDFWFPIVGRYISLS